MSRLDAELVKGVINNEFYRVAVDLGCGDGVLGGLIQENVRCLVGVDHDEEMLQKASDRKVYNQLVLADIREYNPPARTKVVFMIELIEHLKKKDGVALLRRLQWIPTIILTTPSKFWRGHTRDYHRSLWTIGELNNQGFFALPYKRKPSSEVFFGHGVIAIKGTIPKEVVTKAITNNQTKQVKTKMLDYICNSKTLKKGLEKCIDVTRLLFNPCNPHKCT